MADELVIADKIFKSRLIVGTGRYRTMEEMVEAIDASGTEMVTVAHPPFGFGQPCGEDHPRLHRLDQVQHPAEYCRV